MPLPFDAFPAQILRDRRCGQTCALQPLQRRGAAWLYVYRHGILGHVPEPVSVAEPRLSVGQRRDSGRAGQCLPRERLPARMGFAGTPRMHGRKQLRIRSRGCNTQRRDTRRGCSNPLRGDARGTRQSPSYCKLHGTPRARIL